MNYRLLVFILLICTSRLLLASPSIELGPGNCTPNQFNDPNQCLNGVGPGVYGIDNVRVTAGNLSTTTQSNDTEEGTAWLGHSNLKGLAAGGQLAGWSLWGSFNYTTFEADLPTNATVLRAKYDANTKGFLVGADRLLADRWVLGLAGGYEDTEVFTNYNGGNNDDDGFTIAPYMAFLIDDHFSVDAAAGYSSLEYDTDRVSVTDGTTTFGSFDSDRYFFSTNINASNTYDRWYLSGRVGYLYTQERQDGYTETGSAASTAAGTVRTVGDRNLHLSQIIVGAEAAYGFDMLEPYVGLTYANDLTRGLGFSAGGLPGGVATTNDDDDELQLNGGFRHFGDGYSASMDFMHVISRNNFDSYSIMMSFRADL